MLKTPKPPRSGCPINFCLEIFGDGFSLLILRDVVLHQKRSFSEFLTSGEGIATNILSDRLHRLTQIGLLLRGPSDTDGRKVIYTPTKAAIALVPVLAEMAYWGATHDAATAAPADWVLAYQTDRAMLLQSMTPHDES